MDLALGIIIPLIAVTSVVWLIFFLTRFVDRWTQPQFVLFWVAGIAAIVVFSIGTAHVQTTTDHDTTRCIPGRDADCRATGAPLVSASGDTACCYPGITEYTYTHTTALGEATKMALIMLVTTTGMGLIILGSQWMRRLPPTEPPPIKRKGKRSK